MASEPGESIPILTEVILSAAPTLPPLVEREAELQTTLAARAYTLTEDVLRAAFAELEANLFARITSQLRRELPELIDATLREHLGEERG
jgi:hypothetical protein